MVRRSDWKIYNDILLVIRENGGCKKTRIMQDSHLSWESFKNHFEFLNKNDFVEESDDYFQITEKGQKLLQHLYKVDKILNHSKIDS